MTRRTLSATFAVDLVVVAVAAVVCSCAPAVITGKGRDLPPAYGLKLMRPFADTSVLTIPAEPGERSHGNKLTPRLVGSVLLWGVGTFRGHPYIPATLGTLAFLASGLVLGRRLGASRQAGLALALTYAGLFATSIGCARIWMPKPFDGIALGLIGLSTASIGSPLLAAGWGFLALWTDERAIVSLSLSALLVLLLPDLSKNSRREHWLALGAAVAMYALSRSAVGWWLGWRSADMSNLFDDLPAALLYTQWAAWGCAEGGWMIVAGALFTLLHRQKYASAIALTAGISLALASTLVVQDLSRAGAFCFPLIPLAGACLAQQRLPRLLTVGLWFAAIVSLLAPNCEIVRGVAMTWAMPLPVALLMELPAVGG